MSLTDTEILNVVRSEAANTIGTSDFDSELGKQRSDAINYYHGKMDDFPHLPGWSKVTTRDVFETIESIMPDLLEIFTSTEDMMEFQPEGEEDVDPANEETDVVNHVFYQQNNGFMVLYTFVKDALQAKNGFVKVWWEDKETDEVEEYKNKSDVELAILQDDKAVEIVEQTTKTEKTGEFAPKITVEDGQPQMGEEVEIVVTTHNVTVKRTKDSSQVRVQAIPPEEVAISRESLSLQTATLVRHVPKHTTRSELLEIGISKELVNSLITVDIANQTEEEIARDTLFQEDRSNTSNNKSMEKVEVADNYIRIDINENGKSELWHIMTGSDDTVLLSKTRITRVPISTMTPIIEPHQIFGISLADLVMDIQRIKTFLVRAALDNAAATNNQRPIISTSGTTTSTVDDVLMNRPAAPIMVKGDARQAITYAPNNNIAPDMVGLAQYFDTVKAERTGVVRFGQNMDPNELRRDISATEFAGSQIDQLKATKLIARIFAETGLKDMMVNIHHTLKSHSGDKPLSLRINGKFTDVDPRSWINRTDMTVNMSLGTGTKAEQIAQLGQILEQQKIAFATQGNQDGDLVTLSQIRHTLARIVTLQGFKTADAFFNEVDDDRKQPEQQEQPNPELIKIQADAANNQEKNQIEREKNLMNAQLEQSDNDLDRQVKIFQIVQELQLKAKTLDQEFDFKESVAMAKLLLENKKVDLKAESEGLNMGVNFAERLDKISTDLTGPVRVGGELAG